MARRPGLPDEKRRRAQLTVLSALATRAFGADPPGGDALARLVEDDAVWGAVLREGAG